MARSRRSKEPAWQRVLVIAFTVYALLVWALPALMLPFANVLPYVHERTVFERLPFSVAGTALVVLAFVVLERARRPARSATAGSRWGDLGPWAGVVAGFALATYAGASLSANLFGLAAKLLPHEAYRVRVTIESADHSGSSRYRAVELAYKDPASGERRYLVLSKRLFDYPDFQLGDVVELRGRSTLVGIYIEEFALLAGRSTSQSH
jgi:hypothetical protein